MLVFAAITDKLVDFATNVVGDLGLFGVFALMVPESACIPIPSEATMLFSGFNLSPQATHHADYTLVTLTLVGVVANVVGSWIAYAVLALIVVGIAYLLVRRRRRRAEATA